MKKVVRGQYGYLAYKKKSKTIFTAVLFLIPLTLFAAGIITTKTRLNALTIIAILGMLPASQYAVNTFMYLKSKGISEQDYLEFEPFQSSFNMAFENVFTTYEKTYEVPVLVVKNKMVLGYVTAGSDGATKLEEHIKTCAQKEGLSVHVTMIPKKDTFLKRLKALKDDSLKKDKLETNENEDIEDVSKVLKLLFEISL